MAKRRAKKESIGMTRRTKEEIEIHGVNDFSKLEMTTR